ncbi:S-adenosyl-L-methionine-dependent methyltransferase [Rostrohypoxylon terebratum]|nr:S-adenosyl-L-methionine-dependent methyltransferase [Rostrohypoxylon terebratum]
MENNETQKNESTARSGTSLLALAEKILEQTKTFTGYLQSNNLAEPTFSPRSSEPPATDEYLELQTSLRTSLEDLQRLVEGPRRYLRSCIGMGYDIMAFQIALEFHFFTLVPPDGEISMVDLAEKASLDLDRVSRVVRMLITHRIFQEKRPGYVSHSTTSLVLLEDEEVRSAVHYTYDEMLKAIAETSDSLRKCPSEADSTHCPFHTTHGLSLYQYYAKYPDKAARFAKAMAGVAKMDLHITELRDCFSWGELTGTVIDVGGGSGHISMSLARVFPHLSFVVQDGSANMLAEGRALLTDDVRGRITFTQHSFFEPQPSREGDPAAAYLIRQCTHNWCDRDVVTIFRSLVPGLESSGPATPLLINDIILPEPGEDWPRLQERDIRQIDMIVLLNCGAKQRTKTEFEALLRQADARYEIRKVHAAGPLGLLEVYLRN